MSVGFGCFFSHTFGRSLLLRPGDPGGHVHALHAQIRRGAGVRKCKDGLNLDTCFFKRRLPARIQKGEAWTGPGLSQEELLLF